MLRQFFYAWLLYWFAIAILPVHSIYPSVVQALILQIGFVLVVALSAKVVLDMFGVKQMPAAADRNIPHATTLIWIAIFLALLGLAALAYDKVFIQKIDYTAGLAFAREEWRQLGEDREGRASSIFSVMGYLLGSSYYVAAVLAVTQGAVLSRRTRLVALLTCFILLMANSALTGGRSNILLIGVFIVASFSSRRGLSLRGVLGSAFQRRLFQGLAGVAFAYSIYIFYERAATNSSGAIQYAVDFLPYLGVEADPIYRNALVDGTAGSLSAVMVLAGSYITHSFSSVAAIVDAPVEDKSLLFLNEIQMLYKLGVVGQPDPNWFLVGRLSSVPGALWHQFGAVGFFIGSTLLGAFAGASKVWLVRRPNRLMPLGAYTMATSTLILTPAVFAPDFLSFPFVFAAFVMLPPAALFVNDLLGRQRAKAPRAEPAAS